MNLKIKEISIKEAGEIILDKYILEAIKKSKEPVFVIVGESSPELVKINPLVEVEISLRKCERLGVFEK